MIDNPRASNGGMVGSGELLHELEEKMEVARVQLQLVEAIGSLHRTPDVEASVAKVKFIKSVSSALIGRVIGPIFDYLN